MCIIIVKKLGVKFPSIENVENSCNNNPDGFAIAWSKGGIVYNYRTMNHKDFINKCKEVFKNDYKTTSCVIHARIATHGSVGVKNTHCWIDQSTALAFAHNGVLSVKNRGDMTDSETFFRDIFLPIYSKYGWAHAELAINACIGQSKFAFLNANGDIRVFGNYNELKGVLYSNTSYLPRTTYYGSTSTGYQFRESIWNPAEKKFVYRDGHTNAEWDAIKKDIASKSFWDYAEGKYRIRTTESDEEWKSLRQLSDLAFEETRNNWSKNPSRRYWEY